MKTLSLSILEYESVIPERISTIEKLLSLNLHLHIDVMRKPFIPDRSAFSEKTLALIYNTFPQANLDFHLMTNYPTVELDFINSIIDPNRRKSTIITIHRESFRQGMGIYESKEYDLLAINTGNAGLDYKLRQENARSGDQVYKSLKSIKENGYLAGLALEPFTSLDNITDELASVADMILLMSVISGKGGQEYIANVTQKIREVKAKYNSIVQVDGGIKYSILPIVVSAGADNIVIGSDITAAEDPVDRTKSIISFINEMCALHSK